MASSCRPVCFTSSPSTIPAFFITASASIARRALRASDKLHELLEGKVGSLIDAVREIDDSYEDPEEQHKDAWNTIARMSAYAEMTRTPSTHGR